MTLPLWCLLGYALWTLLLVGGIGAVRVREMIRGEKKPNDYTGGVPHGSPGYWRLCRAHANACENLPIVGAIVVVGTLAQAHATSTAFRVLPAVVLGARVVQSLAHVWSAGVAAASLRFGAFVAQNACLTWMMIEIARVALRQA